MTSLPACRWLDPPPACLPLPPTYLPQHLPQAQMTHCMHHARTRAHTLRSVSVLLARVPDVLKPINLNDNMNAIMKKIVYHHPPQKKNIHKRHLKYP